MRTSIAALGSITILFVGVFAMSESAQQSKDAVTNGTASSDAYNVSTAVFNNVTQGGGQGIVWFGIAAVILVALGFLVTAAGAGGR